jgi:hypothetical protein
MASEIYEAEKQPGKRKQKSVRKEKQTSISTVHSPLTKA